MNSNNWLAFPLSPTHSSLPPHLQTSSQSQVAHQFSLGLLNDNIDHSPYQEWNLMNSHTGNEVPKVADFLGVGTSDNQSDLVAYHNNDSDYLFVTNALLPDENTVTAEADSSQNNYEYQENASNNLQSLTLSMGSVSGTSKVSSSGGACETTTTTTTTADNPSNNNAIVEAAPRRTLDTFGQRTSIYRGVTRHRWTGRYEAHLWDNSCRREGQSRKGRQVYLGGYDKEDKAARAYDLAALKYWGTSTTTNFPINNYEKEVDEMKHMTRQEFVASIRRKSSGFSRGASMYRGVTRHHQHGRWQARIGRVAGNKDLYLGTFTTEEEAAEAYDIAAIKFRGLNAVTNFDMNRYDVKSILESNTLPIGGGAAKRLKEAHALETSRKREEMMSSLGSSFQYGSSSSSSRLQAQTYPLLQQQPTFDQQPLPLLTLQNQDISHQYTQDPAAAAAADQFHQSYIQTQLQLHQQSGGSYLYSTQNNPHQFYTNTYLQNSNPSLLHGLMMNIDNNSNNNNNNNNGSSSGSYSGDQYLGGGNGLDMALNNPGGVAASEVVGSTSVSDELAMVKVDYDMQPSGGYGGWSGDLVSGSNPGVFSMWND